MYPENYSAASAGNYELERVLNYLGANLQSPLHSFGNTYIVVPSDHAMYVDFVRRFNRKYSDSSEMIQTTISLAYTAAVASRFDKIYVVPGYTETVTAVKTLSKIGVSLIGLGEGLARPSITGNGTIDVFSLTGANQLLENFAFPAPGTDDQTADINVAAAGCVIRNTYHIGSTTSKNKTDIITVASGGDDLTIRDVRMYNTVVDVVAGISLEAAVARTVIRDTHIQGTFSTACLMDEATATLGRYENLTLKNTKTTGTTFNWTNNSTGVMRFVHSSGRNTTIASNYVLGSGMDFFEHRLVEEAALNGAVLPAADSD